MAWPDDRDLPIEVEAGFGADVTADPGTWSWTDLSSRMRNAPIQLRAGRSGGTGQLSPGTCSVTLDNDDSALTPLHPVSPYWPNVDLGTPLRVRLRRAEHAFASTVNNGWGVADSGQAWSVTNGPTSAFSTAAGVAKHTHTAVNTLRRITLATSLVDDEQVIDVASPVLLTGAALVTGLVFRYSNGGSDYYWLRCEFNSGGTTVTLKIAKCVGGTFTDLAALNPAPGLTYAANSYLRVRASVVGTSLAIKAWNPAGAEPAGWQLTATDSTITAAGGTGTQSWLVPGNTNTLPLSVQFKNYTVRVDRFGGFADQWEPTYLPTGVVGQMSSAVRITASGVLRRLSQGEPPEWSPLRRTIAASGALAYWPVEDGVTAGQAGSAIVGQPPLNVTGTVSFRPVDDYVDLGYVVKFGTSALADLAAGGELSAGSLPTSVASATASRWTVHVVAGGMDPATMSGDVVLLEWTTPGGTYVRWRLVAQKSPTRTQVYGYDAAGASTLLIEYVGLLFGFAHYAVSAFEADPVQVVELYVSGNGPDGGNHIGTATHAGVTGIAVNPTNATSTAEMPFGHVAVWGTSSPPVDFAGSLDSSGVLVNAAWASYENETAINRLARLCAEEGVPLDIPAVSGDAVTRMGGQEPGAFIGLTTECVEVDGGILHEQGFHLGYLPREVRYNQPVALTIDLSTYATTRGDAVLNPAYDDQNIRNRWTVKRRDGSFAIAEDTASQGRGVYGDSVELNLASDTALADQASWRVHLDTIVDLREATFPIDLAANPDLIDGWLSCGVGSRVVRTNPPAQYRPGPLDRLVEGWAETIGPRSWQVRVNPSPASPWDVATVDGEQRVPAVGSYLAAGAAMDDTTLLVATPIEAAWTTNPADLPLDIQHAGERMMVTAITPRVAPGFVATGTGTNGNNTSRTPALPAGWAQGDLLLIYATARSTPDHRAVAPDGYLTLFQDRNVALFGKLAAAAEVAPTVTFVGGVANSDTIAQMAAFRGVAPGVMTSATRLNASAQNIAYPALSVPQPALILYLGWRQDDWTSVAALAGATEVGSRSSTLGDDAAQVWDYTIQPSQANITAGQFVVTGGLPAVSRGAVVALWANVQQMTVVRGVNGARKAHPPSSGV